MSFSSSTQSMLKNFPSQYKFAPDTSPAALYSFLLSYSCTTVKMKGTIAVVISLVAVAVASPVYLKQGKRQTEEEFTDGGCRDIIFIWARGSTETGNMVSHISRFCTLGFSSTFTRHNCK
jgi:hypothetical protein